MAPQCDDQLPSSVVLCVYRQVKILKETAIASKKKPSDAVAIISYDETPGIQPVAITACRRRPACMRGSAPTSPIWYTPAAEPPMLWRDMMRFTTSVLVVVLVLGSDSRRIGTARSRLSMVSDVALTVGMILTPHMLVLGFWGSGDD